MEESKWNFCGIPYIMQISRRFHENFTQISRRFNAEFSQNTLRNLYWIDADFHRGIYAECVRNSIQHSDFAQILQRFNADFHAEYFAESMRINPWWIYMESMRTFTEESMRIFCGIQSSIQISRRFRENFTKISQRFKPEFHAENFAESMQNPCETYGESMRTFMEEAMHNFYKTPSSKQISGRFNEHFTKISRRFHLKFHAKYFA